MRRDCLLSLVFCLCLAGCGGSGGTAPVTVVDMGLKGESVGIATVQDGDSLSEIADRYRLSMRAIIALNDLAPPYVIYPQQRLKLPPPRQYRVKAGDTIYDISRMFSTTQNSIVRLNAIPKPYTIRVGQVLTMPLPEEAIPDPAVIRSKPQSQAVQTLKRKAKIQPPKMAGNGKFLQPVSGRIISAYGPKSGGLHNDGINIAARAGDPVKAAQSGVVAYTGDAIAGYGNLVLIRHDSGYITAYAHLDTISVKRGDMVTKGGAIGRVGSTGNVSEPQVHFEIRKGTKALNPQLYL